MVDPRKRRLVTNADAIKTTNQHRKPCADCPWSRSAIKGWLGSQSAEEWISEVIGDSRMECHVATVQCAGAAIFRRNICKLPRDQALLVLPVDRELVFSNPSEFLNHHTIG